MGRLILITDAHVGTARESTLEFFQMLARIEDVEGDLVFLGDIFDLWIALSRYETEVHQRFLEWCRRQKRFRSLGFMEGNHEFFVARERSSAFGWCTDRPFHRQGDILYLHGDQINRRDVHHLSFRRLTRNRLAQGLLRVAPAGPRLAGKITALFKTSNPRPRTGLPMEAIRKFADASLARGVDTVLVGHFHQELRLHGGRTGNLYLLPDWQTSRKITLFDLDSRSAANRRWDRI